MDIKTLRLVRIVLWGGVVLALLAVAWLGVVRPRMQAARVTDDRVTDASEITDTLGQGDYELIATDGTPFTQARLSEGPAAVFFGFTHCPDVCPTTLGDIMGWQEELEAEGQNLRVFFLTVDPERDTPGVLGDYVSWVPGVTGVTGDPEQMARAIAAFRVHASKEPLADGGYTVNHSTPVLLFDDGRYFGLIAYQEGHDRAMGTIRRLLDS